MKHVRTVAALLSIVVACAGSAAAQTPSGKPASDAAQPAAKVRSVLVVRITEGLDCTEAVRAFIEASHRAEREDAAAVLLELSDTPSI